MTTKAGFSSLNRTITGGVSKGDSNPLLLSLKDKFISARVKNIILDENSENFEDLEKWASIGSIQYEIVDYQTPEGELSGIAYPLFPNIKHYPLLEEIVLLIKLPGKYIGEFSDDDRYYYLPPVSIWNHPHHNANPNQVKSSGAPESQTKSTQQISAGSSNKTANSEESLDFNGNSGGTFVEKTNIHPLLPFAGDVILEGRFGNSIRLGNTSKTDSTYANIWSTTGNNGDPITILRNGQSPESSEEGWLPVTENINTDVSSITLTSTQKIPINLSNEDYSAFNEPPTTAQEYTDNQVILNSGRLLFNSRQDDIIISSGNKVAIQGIKTVGISSDADITLNSTDVRLGNKTADQQLVLGNDFMVQFEALVQGVSNLCDKLKTSQNWPGGAAVPNVPLIGVAINTKVTAEAILNNIKKGVLLSKASRTI